MKIVISFIGSICLSLVSWTQPLMWVEGVDLSIGSDTDVFIEGGVNWELGGFLRNEGSLFLGSSGSGFVPSSIEWYQADALLAGNQEGFEGQVLLLGKGILQRIWGTDSLSFSNLYLASETISEGILAVQQLVLDKAHLQLNAYTLHIFSPQPQGIQTLNGGGIKGDTYITQEGAYTRVFWHIDSTVADTDFSIPFLSKRGQEIPMGFSVQQGSNDPVVAFTYPTDSTNAPYPVQMGTIGDVDHLFDALGRDFSPYFIDRFWYLHAGENVLSGLSLSYDLTDVSAGVTGRDQDLQGQWWNGGKWTYFNLGSYQGNRTVSWDSPRSFSGIWSLSIDQLAVAHSPELEVSSLEIYPNPSQGLCFIDLEFPTALSPTARLLNSAGQKVWEKGFSQTRSELTFTLDLSSYASGLYELQIMGNGKRISRKIAKY